MKALTFLQETRDNYLNDTRAGARWPNHNLWGIVKNALTAMYEGGESADFYGKTAADIAALPELAADADAAQSEAVLRDLDLPIAETAIERLRKRVMDLAEGANVPGADPGGSKTAALDRGLDGRAN